jgi:hypothetical protein
MRCAAGVGVIVALLVAADSPAVQPDPCALQFGTPVQLTPALATGYEPGVEVDSQGTIFVTAHKGGAIAEPDDGALGARGASWLWRSVDGGRTFLAMDGLMGATRESFAFEGDIAVDARDRMYFADLTLADNHFYRYSERGATMDLYRPLLASAQGDDRPWLAAHHDGVVYYLSNARAAGTGNVVLHRSTDAGATFDTVGFTFPGSGLGHIAADPNSDHVHVFTNDWLFFGDDGDGDTNTAVVWTSADRGSTWKSVEVFDYETGDAAVPPTNNNGMIGGAVSPKDGSVAFVEIDGEQRKLRLARSADRGATWTVADVAPFAGIYSTPWVAFSPQGDLGLIFEADPDDPGYEEGAHVFAMLWRPDGSHVFGRVHPKTTNPIGPGQADFFQLAFTPDGRIVTAYADHGEGPAFSTGGGPVFFNIQTAGPNLGSCAQAAVSGPDPSPGTSATTPAARSIATELELVRARLTGRRLAVRALLAPRGAGPKVILRIRGGGVGLRRTLRVASDGRISATVRLRRRVRRVRVELSYPGSAGYRAATAKKTVAAR